MNFNVVLTLKYHNEIHSSLTGPNIYIYIYIYIYQPLRSGRIWHRVNFLAEFNRFEFRVFLLLD